ncbi:MAG: tRNA 5-methoxyuridine(34)/uridine 5-oxyacetic acid(34) synthase CmoB [Candidatus Dasytiphilus stammeri]
MKKKLINFKYFYRKIILEKRLIPWLNKLPAQLIHIQHQALFGTFKKWLNYVYNLPEIIPDYLDFKYSVTAVNHSISKDKKIAITKLLSKLIPWRKGPFYIYGINIDSEWRSDKKWQRIIPHISDLKGRLVLDVGCGNGYHLWRILGSGAKLVIGIDPNKLFFCQFKAIKKLLGNEQHSIHFLPLKIEQLPSVEAFHTVFSMGVLYHRKSPLDHLCYLRNQLVFGGELILETLIINHQYNQIFMPSKYYANMPNVWFIPSASALKIWLKRCGFKEIKIVNFTNITSSEQRSTNWSQSRSLYNVNITDPTKTVEGYPVPLRVIVIAKK